MSKKEHNPQPEQEPSVEPQVEVMPSLEEMLAEAERKAQEHYDAWMYAKAEAENIRRRAHEDTEKARKFALEKFSSELLSVKDSLDAALNVESATVESYKSGQRIREIQHRRTQPARRKVRPAQASGNQHGGSRRRAEQRGASAAEGLHPARARTAPGAGHGCQGQGLKSIKPSPPAGHR